MKIVNNKYYIEGCYKIDNKLFKRIKFKIELKEIIIMML